MVRKKVFIILIGVIVISAVGFFAWKFLPLNKDNKAAEQPPPAEDVKSIEYITSEPITDPVLAYDNLSIWFFDKSGNLLRQHLSDKSDLKQYPLPEHGEGNWVLWPDSGSDFIIGTEDEKLWYDSRSDKFIPYPDGVKYIVWMPGARRVAYVWSSAEATGLYAALPNATDYKRIAGLPHAGFRIAPSPNGQSFALFDGSGRMPIYFVIQGIGVLEPITNNLAVEVAKFSPEGNRLAFIENREGNGYLNILDISSRAIKLVGTINTQFNFTWSAKGDKLVWPDMFGRLQVFNAASGALEDIPSEIAKLKVKYIIPGRDDDEFFFQDLDSGRLGKFLLK